MLDNRGAARQPSYLGGKITYNRDLWSEECVVRNCSTTGAKLRVADPRILPDRFGLTIPQRDIACTAQVRWRERNEIGVAFETGTPARVVDLSSFRSKRLSVPRKLRD